MRTQCTCSLELNDAFHGDASRSRALITRMPMSPRDPTSTIPSLRLSTTPICRSLFCIPRTTAKWALCLQKRRPLRSALVLRVPTRTPSQPTKLRPALQSAPKKACPLRQLLPPPPPNRKLRYSRLYKLSQLSSIPANLEAE